MEYDKKLDAEIVQDIIKLKEKCKKAYHLSDFQAVNLYWGIMHSVAFSINAQNTD